MTAVPVAATDAAALNGPLEIRIAGANGELRDFVALSTADRHGASALVELLAAATQGPPQPIEAPPGLPHYRVDVSHFRLTYGTTPWARVSKTNFIYYPGDPSSTFLLVEFRQGDAELKQVWIQPSPEVAALLAGHLHGIAPIATQMPAPPAPPEPWGMPIGAVVLAALSLVLLRDRRRWGLSDRGRSAGKGT
jgi:hypothetical protein